MSIPVAEIEKHVHIPSGSVSLGARLTVPAAANKLVVFAHGSGSSQFSPRNNFVADVLAAHGFAVLVMDLLTTSEDLSHKNRFNIELLAARLTSARHWIGEEELLRDCAIGIFGVNTGAAAALKVAARLDHFETALDKQLIGTTLANLRSLEWKYLRRPA